MSATQGAKEPTIEYSDSTLTAPAGDDAYGDRSVYGKNPNPDNDTTSYGRDTNINTSAIGGSSDHSSHSHSHPSGVNTSNLTGDHSSHHNHGVAPTSGAGLLSTGTSGFAQEQSHISHTGDSTLHNQQLNSGAAHHSHHPVDTHNQTTNVTEASRTEHNLHASGHDHAAERVAAGGLGAGVVGSGLAQKDHHTGNFQNQSVPPAGQPVGGAHGLKSEYDKAGNRIASHPDGTTFEQEHPEIHDESNKNTSVVDKIKAKLHM